MTSISIIGTGRAAGFHAAASLMADHVELEGIVGRHLGHGAELANRAGVPELTLEQALSRSEALVVAVPPADALAVLNTVADRVSAVLVETPCGLSGPGFNLVADLARPPTMVAANLLHAPVTRQALREIAAMNKPHHFVLRHRGPKPDWGDHGSPRFGGGAIVDPGCRILPLLLAALAAPVVAVSGELIADSRRIDISASLELQTDVDHHRDVSVDIRWNNDAPTTALEVASSDAVVQLELAPPPSLEVNGESVYSGSSENPYLELGFIDQITRLGSIARGDASPWPDFALASGLIDIATAAAFSSSHQGIGVSPGAGYPQRSVWSLMGGS